MVQIKLFQPLINYKITLAKKNESCKKNLPSVFSKVSQSIVPLLNIKI